MLSRIKKTFISIVSGVICITPAFADNCANPTYAASHQSECERFSFFTTKNMTIGGGILGLGGIAAIVAGNASSGGNSNDNPVPTLRTYLRGTDISEATLASIQSRTDYAKNTNQYNEINVAYSLARGYTGKNSVISVFDSGDDTWHGQTVAKITNGVIAPDATVHTYKITDNNMNFISYDEIGNKITASNNTNIFNNSWNIPNVTANAVHNRKQIENMTSTNFISTIERAATQNDAIFVFAAGNNSYANSGALSALPHVVPTTSGHIVNVVAWDDATGGLASYSNACGITRDWCITAPGTNIHIGTIPANGTSFAAPIVSAAIAVIRQAFPYMNSSEITNLLFTTARDLGEIGVDDIYGHGMLDLEAATRPVGAPTIMISENVSQPLNATRISAPVAHSIKKANIKLAYFDDFGRAFDTNMNNHIKTQNIGRGFGVLTGRNNSHGSIGNLEFGIEQNEIFAMYGFMSTDDKPITKYMALNNKFNIKDIELSLRGQIGITRPHTTAESIISDFSNIYTTTIAANIKYNDLTFGISAPDMITSGTLSVRTATARNADGSIQFSDYNVSIVSRPMIEYSVNYKFLTAAFVDNPYGTDEFYILAKTKLHF